MRLVWVHRVQVDIADPGDVDSLVADRADVVFHLAAVVSGEAESDFEKGYRVNLDGTRLLLEAIRANPRNRPRFVFALFIAVFGLLSRPRSATTSTRPR